MRVAIVAFQLILFTTKGEKNESSYSGFFEGDSSKVNALFHACNPQRFCLCFRKSYAVIHILFEFALYKIFPPRLKKGSLED